MTEAKIKSEIRTWESKLNGQFRQIVKQLEPGETIAHCIDSESFKGRFFKPCWVVTSKARVWSLSRRRWLKISLIGCGKKLQTGKYSKYRYATGGLKIHNLVANYFCDKKPIEIFGESGVNVSHKRLYDSTKSNEWNNAAEFLEYTSAKDNQSTIKKLQNNTFKDCDQVTMLFTALAKANGGLTSITYDDYGNPKLNQRIDIKPKHTFEEGMRIFNKIQESNRKKTEAIII